MLWMTLYTPEIFVKLRLIPNPNSLSVKIGCMFCIDYQTNPPTCYLLHHGNAFFNSIQRMVGGFFGGIFGWLRNMLAMKKIFVNLMTWMPSTFYWNCGSPHDAMMLYSIFILSPLLALLYSVPINCCWKGRAWLWQKLVITIMIKPFSC